MPDRGGGAEVGRAQRTSASPMIGRSGRPDARRRAVPVIVKRALPTHSRAGELLVRHENPTALQDV
jgi:hypothetical protein